MIDDKLLELVARVAAKARDLAWKFDNETNGYYVKMGKSYVELRSDDVDDAHPYSFLILDEEANVIQRISTASSEVPLEARAEIERIFKVAKRKGTGLDDRINDILGELS